MDTKTWSESIILSVHFCETLTQTLLLNFEPHISKAVYVVSFFKAKPGDKQLTR